MNAGAAPARAAGAPPARIPASGPARPPHPLGRGAAHGAITILNGTAGGIGCSLAVQAGTQATWQWRHEPGLALASIPHGDDRLARAVAALGPGRGAVVTTRSAWPAQRGLKTSSGAAAAMLRAARPGIEDDQVLRLAVAASRAAGVTVTGAWDDQAAVTLGGCRVADSGAGKLLRAVKVPPWHVAIWVPSAVITKSAIARLDASALAPEVAALAHGLTPRRVPAALTANGELYHGLYAAAGLPVTRRPAEVATASGALGAGLSGCGPAVAALFDEPVALAPVAGGTWAWTRVAP